MNVHDRIIGVTNIPAVFIFIKAVGFYSDYFLFSKKFVGDIIQIILLWQILNLYVIYLYSFVILLCY